MAIIGKGRHSRRYKVLVLMYSVMKVHRSRELSNREPYILSPFSEQGIGEDALFANSFKLGEREAKHLRKLPEENALTSPSS